MFHILITKAEVTASARVSTLHGVRQWLELLEVTAEECDSTIEALRALDMASYSDDGCFISITREESR